METNLKSVQSVQNVKKYDYKKSLPQYKFKPGDIVYHGVTHNIFIIIGTAKGIRNQEDKYKAFSANAFEGHDQIAKSVMDLGHHIGNVTIPDFYPKEWDSQHVIKNEKKEEVKKELDFAVHDTLVKIATEPIVNKEIKELYSGFRIGKFDIHTLVDELREFKKREEPTDNKSYLLNCIKELNSSIKNKTSELNDLRLELFELKKRAGVEV